MRLTLAIPFLLVSCFAASADQMQLTVNDLLALNAGLSALSAGAPRVIKDGEKESVVTKPFELTGPVRIAIGKDSFRVAEQLLPIQKEIQALRVSLCRGECKDAEKDAFDAEINKIGERKVDLDLVLLSEADLKLDVNPGISGALLQALRPILSFMK